MEYQKDKVDEFVLALLFLNTLEDPPAIRARKNFDWDSMERLYEMGYISDPRSKAKSVVMTEEGLKVSEALYLKHLVE